jgi:Flp pilus assembly protein TadG
MSPLASFENPITALTGTDMVQRKNTLQRNRRRRGTAVTELAVCLPTIALLLLGSIECCNMIFVQQALTVAGYEGARASVRHNAINSDVTVRTNNVLTARKVNSATVNISAADVTLITPGNQITITVSAPCAANSYLPPWFFGGRTLVGRCSMVKE